MLGLINAPRGQRIFSGLCHVRNRAPFLGGNFALWGGMFSSMDCLLISYRQKDDPLNAIMAGAVTGGLLAIRGGTSVAFKQAMMGGFILFLIEGASQLFMAIQIRNQHLMMKQMQEEMMMRQMQIASQGGENPWEVSYNKDQASNIAKSEAGADLKDSASESGGLLDKATKSFSF